MRRFGQRALLGGALALLWAQVASAFTYYPASPQGSVGLSRPTISQRLVLERGEEFLRAQMWLDGVKVRPAWNGTDLVSYTPTAPLAPGNHSVKLSVEITPATPGYIYDPLISEFTLRVADGAVESLPGRPGPEESRALERVNAYRAQAGLGPLAYNAALGAAAQAHARYLIANPAQRTSDPHHERPGTPLFTGQAIGDRVGYFGFGGAAAEVINYLPRAEEAVDGWMATLYHRIPVIHPGSVEMGYGLSGQGESYVTVLEAGQTDSSPGVALWPRSGAADVPASWDGAEEPDPFDLFPGVRGPVGFPITLTFGGTVRSLTLTAATLTGPQGDVSVMRFSPENDSRLSDTVCLIPYAPFSPGATYTVRLSGVVDRGGGPEAYDRTWKFTTASEVPLRLSRRVVTTGPDDVVKAVEIEGAGFAQGMKLFLGGLPVEGLEVDSAAHADFQPPRGFAGGTADLLAVSPSGREVTWPGFVKASDGLKYSPDGSPWTSLPVRAGGRSLDQPAMVSRATGALLLPEPALQALGAVPAYIRDNGRTYWSFGGLTGDYTPDRTAATAGAVFTLALPVQRIDGVTYVDAGFVRRLTGATVTAGSDGVEVGIPVEGMYDIASHWAHDAIARLLKAGVVSGNGDGTFRPDATLTRAAFVKMLVGARGVAVRPGETGGFADVAGHWVSAQGYLGAAVRAGIVAPDEYPGGLFEPDQPIFREEIAVMVDRALGRGALAASRSVALDAGRAVLGGKLFTDAWQWNRPGFVAEAVDAGIVTGYKEADGTYTFRPVRQATRAEAAVMTVRAMDAR